VHLYSSVFIPECKAHLFYAGLCITCLAWPYLFTLSHKRQDIREKVLNIKCFNFLHIYLWNFSHYKKNSARYYFKYTQIIMQSTGCSCQILMKLVSIDRISKNVYTSNFMKIRPVWAELFLADRQTKRHDKANIRYSLFC
jgi:hypothetical protein